jgi:hypothetical protein
MPRSVARMAVRTALAALAAAGLVAVGNITPATAQITSFCSGIAGPVTVPGDLIVRANDFCVLEGTVVNGNTTVRAGASLITTEATFHGRVTAQSDAYVELTASTVNDRVVLRDAFGLLAVDSTLNENVAVNVVDPAAPPGAVLLINTTVQGNVNASVGAVWIGDSRINGRVTGNGVDFVDLVNTVLGSNLSVTGAAEGSVICDSEIYGTAAYVDNSGPVQLGGDSLIAGCLGANYWHGSVSIDGTSGDVIVTDNIIRLDLSGDGNDPQPVGVGNRVRGETSGQFADLAAPASTAKAPSLSPNRSAQTAGDRGATLQKRLELRGKAARIVADMMGSAGL